MDLKKKPGTTAGVESRNQCTLVSRPVVTAREIKRQGASTEGECWDQVGSGTPKLLFKVCFLGTFESIVTKKWCLKR